MPFWLGTALLIAAIVFLALGWYLNMVTNAEVGSIVIAAGVSSLIVWLSATVGILAGLGLIGAPTLGALAAAFVIFSLAMAPNANSGINAIASLLASAVVLALVYAKLSWVTVPRAKANGDLDRLELLTPISHPEQCIEFVKWVATDKTIRAYQHQLASMGRTPIMAEYQLAKSWMAQKDEYAKNGISIENAKLAFAKLATRV